MTPPEDALSPEASIEQELIRQFETFLYDRADAIPAARALLNDDNNEWQYFLIQSVTGLELPPDEARQVWLDILKHWRGLILSLKRNPGLHVSCLDFFHNFNDREVSVRIQIAGRAGGGSNVYDGLTGLPRESDFLDALEAEVTRSGRYEKGFVLALLSIDEFDLLHTTRGAQISSEVIRQSGELIQTTLRSSDRAFRLSDQTFALILSETDRTGGFIVSERICIHSELNLKSFQGTVSGGLALFPDDGSDMASLRDAANKSLRIAREQGGNRVCPGPDERRAYPRLSSALMVRLKPTEGEVRPADEAITQDVSGGGFAFEMSRYFAPEQAVQGEIELPEKMVAFWGRIVRCEEKTKGRFEVAVEFTMIDPEARLSLLAYTQ